MNNLELEYPQPEQILTSGEAKAQIDLGVFESPDPVMDHILDEGVIGIIREGGSTRLVREDFHTEGQRTDYLKIQARLDQLNAEAAAHKIPPSITIGEDDDGEID